MSGYKLMYNTPNGGVGSLGLMKNYAFNNSMCDGIYLKQVVPPSTTETTMTLLFGLINLDIVFSIKLTKPVDEYITVVLNMVNDDTNELYSTTCICPAGSKFAKAIVNADASYMYSAKSIYVYAGKRLVLSAEGHREILNNIINMWTASADLSIVRYLDADGNQISESELSTHKLTCNNETVYVYPLCKIDYIRNGSDAKSIHLPALRYNDGYYIPTIKLSMNDSDGELNKEDVLNKVVNYVPSFIGSAIKEENNLKDEDIAAEDTSGVGDIPSDSSGTEFDPNDYDFTPPEFVGGLVFPEYTFTEVTENIVKNSTTEAVRDTVVIEETPVEDTSSGDSGSSGEPDYIITGGTMVKYDVIGGAWGTVTGVVKLFKGDAQAGNMRTFPVYDADGNYLGGVVQLLDKDGNVVQTNSDDLKLLSGGGTLYVNEETGAYTYIDKKGNITISDGTKEGNRYYEYTGATNNVGHDVYIGEDGFPVYVWTDPDTGEKIFM